MFRFAHPTAFLLLIPLGVAVWFVYRKRTRGALLFSSAGRLPRAATWRTAASLVVPALFLAGLLLSILALARPQTVLSRVRRSADAIAIEMVLDVSGSMEALDMSDIVDNTIQKERSRLDAVKEVFAKFVAQRPDDLIGLITFGGYASTRVPLTLDHNALLQVLEGVQIPKEIYDKNRNVLNQDELLTAIGDAVATACARLRASDLKSRIMVLLTDGEQTVRDPRTVEPLTAAEAARKLGFKIYTIGVGTTGRAPFWGTDMLGRRRILVGDVRLDEELLRKMAGATGGQYFNVRNPKGLRDALEEINHLEKTRVQRDTYSHFRELFPWALVPALGLLSFGMVLNMWITRRIV